MEGKTTFFHDLSLGHTTFCFVFFCFIKRNLNLSLESVFNPLHFSCKLDQKFVTSDPTFFFNSLNFKI